MHLHSGDAYKNGSCVAHEGIPQSGKAAKWTEGEESAVLSGGAGGLQVHVGNKDLKLHRVREWLMHDSGLIHPVGSQLKTTATLYGEPPLEK